MQSDPRNGAGGAANAPCNPNNCPAVSTTGTNTLAHLPWLNQQPELAAVTRRLARRYRLPISVAKVYAEARCAHV